MGLIHLYVRMVKIEAKTNGMTVASSRDLGAGGGGSFGSLTGSVSDSMHGCPVLRRQDSKGGASCSCPEGKYMTRMQSACKPHSERLSLHVQILCHSEDITTHQICHQCLRNRMSSSPVSRSNLWEGRTFSLASATPTSSS